MGRKKDWQRGSSRPQAAPGPAAAGRRLPCPAPVLCEAGTAAAGHHRLTSLTVIRDEDSVSTVSSNMKNSRQGLAHLGRCAVAVSRVGEKVSRDRPGRRGCSRENLIPEKSRGSCCFRRKEMFL